VPRRAAPQRVVRRHFRVEHQYEDGEAKRDDANYCYSAAGMEGRGPGAELHKER